MAPPSADLPTRLTAVIYVVVGSPANPPCSKIFFSAIKVPPREAYHDRFGTKPFKPPFRLSICYGLFQRSHRVVPHGVANFHT